MIAEVVAVEVEKVSFNRLEGKIVAVQKVQKQKELKLSNRTRW